MVDPAILSGVIIFLYYGKWTVIENGQGFEKKLAFYMIQISLSLT